MGPDGALYIADWYNPIIQHGEVDFRDERRDHTHGRIWRVTVKGRPLVDRPQLVNATIDQLLDALRADEDFTRLHAKLQLKARGTVVLPKLAAWLAALDPADAKMQHLRLEGLWTYQSLDVVEPQLLTELLRSKDHHARAAATRVLEQWHARVAPAAALLAVQVEDEHPQVRLEAVRALASLCTAEAAELAMRALDHPTDRFLDHALWLAARDLQPYWLPALQTGKLSFGGNVQHLAFVLQSAGSPGVLSPLMKLLRSGKLPSDRQESVLLLIAALGGPAELRVILDLALTDKTPAAERAELLSALAKAARLRKVQPAGDLQPIATLLDQDNETLKIAAIEAAGLWRLESMRDRLSVLAAAADTGDAARRAALDSLAALGPQSAEALLALCQAGQPPNVRAMAIGSLATLDVQAASSQLVGLLEEEPLATDPAPVIVAVLDRKGGAAALIESLNGKQLLADSAKLAVRAVRSAAREEPALVAAFNAAGGIVGGPRMLSADELSALIADVASQGNAARGEDVFRRADLACFKCHSIAGAGGRVGPDLVSIGASAQVDYLVDSILQPSAKIKENYHSLIVVADGRITSGIKVRETDKELVLRDVEDREISIPADSIEEKKEGASLMPVGLADTLTRGELVDLVRFLSELGRVEPYATGQARVARRWQALLPSAEATDWLDADAKAPPGDDRGLNWTSVYSRVSGSLPPASLPAIEAKRTAGALRVVRCQLEVDAPGKVGLLLGGTVDKIWFDATPLAPESKIVIDATPGVHTITVLLAAKGGQDLRLEMVDVPGSTAQAQIVWGK